MNEIKFNAACEYTREHLNQLDKQLPNGYDVYGAVYNLMEEWSYDNGFGENEWLEWGDEDDVLLKIGRAGR
jgi:hypothetical protein